MSSDGRRDIRFAAETLYRNAQRPLPIPNQHDISRTYYSPQLDLLNFVHEDYIAGYKQDGQMSTVRRFFCLFVLFDLFFMSMLWFICIMMKGETILNALKEQVIHFSIENSLFDIVVVSFARFLLLITFYGVFAINHWIIIALTTTTSCAFLILKVLYYNWISISQPILQVLMIIVSCLLAWGEAWFLDCRVIPQERNAQRFYRLLMAQMEENERSPLLRPYLNSIHSLGQTDGSAANFYSPIESAHNSDSEADENEFYKNKSTADIQAVLDLLKCTEWKVQKICKNTGDRIQTIQRKKFGKIYRLTGHMDVPPKQLFNILYNGIDDMPSWNPTMLEAKVLKKIDNHTDITYSISAPGGGGLVKSRDFVNLRSWQFVLSNGVNSEETYSAVQEQNLPNEPLVIIESNPQQLIKSSSEVDLATNPPSSAMDGSMLSLSKSLGAQVFSEGGLNPSVLEFFSSNSTADEFVDASDSHGAQSTVHSERAENIKDIANVFCDKMYIISAISIKYDGMPELPNYERGENLISGWTIREIQSNSHACTIDWLMCVDLKGSFPRLILDKAFTGVMQEFMGHLRQHCKANGHSV